MTSTPDYDYWKTLDSFTIEDVALLMKGIDPRAHGEIVVNVDGDGVNLSHELAQIISALEAGLIQSYPAFVTAPNRQTKILKQALLPWLKSRGLVGLSEQITGLHSIQSVINELPDSARRLAALRALGGSVKKNTKNNYGWKVTGITKLVAQEKAHGNTRSDEKTVRADLHSAAEDELNEKRAGFSDGLGQR